MPGCSTQATGSRQDWRETATANRSTLRKPIPRSPSVGRAGIASREPPSSIGQRQRPGDYDLRLPDRSARGDRLIWKFQISLVRITPEFQVSPSVPIKEIEATATAT